MNVLFVCNQNKHRSKTAEELFGRRYSVKSKGLYTDHPLSSQDLSWSDTVIVMENSQREEISRRFPREYLSKRIISLDIPDVYGYMQEELVNLLEERMSEVSLTSN